MFTVNREELAWAAGFFDGEGCTHMGHNVNRYRSGAAAEGKKTPCPDVGISQAGPQGREVLERFRDAVAGIGWIGGPYKSKRLNHAESYRYSARGHRATQAVIAMLWPFLGSVKKAQAARIIRAYLDYGPHSRKGRTFGPNLRKVS